MITKLCGGVRNPFGLSAMTFLGCTLAGLASAQEPSGTISHEQIAAAVSAIDGRAAEFLAQTGVPGLAVAVVHKGEMVFAKGYGLRELGQPEAVDADTVFQIASLSKAISGTVVARRVGNTGLSWTTPVQSLLPEFTLSDPWVGSHVTIGDMFSHRSGLPTRAGDYLEDLGFSRPEVMHRLRFLPLTPFRTSYAYTNHGLTVAAEAVAVSAGTDWASLSEDTLFTPLGMAHTSMRFADYERRENRAIGHTLINGAFTPFRSRQPDPQAPAGGASSSVNDLAKWMVMVLNDGDLDGDPFIAAEALTAATTAQVISRPSSSSSGLPSFYGYGFGVGMRGGEYVALSHSGAFLLGAGTTFVMIPSEDLGIVALTNGAPVGVAESLTAEFMDIALTGQVQADWFGRYSPLLAEMLEPVGGLTGQTRPADATDPGPAEVYVGIYANEYFGDAIVEAVTGGLVLRLGLEKQASDLIPWTGNVFGFEKMNENLPYGSRVEVTFSGTEDGSADALFIDIFDGNGLGEFRRR